MAVQRIVKGYPLIGWFVALAVVILVVGVWKSGVLTGGTGDDNLTILLISVGVALLLPFLALAFPRRQVLTMELPTDHLAALPKEELEGILVQLDASKAKGEMDDARYANARQRVLAAIKSKGK
jgi:hypothetical protein